METRSRKRAEASPAAPPPSTRSSKRRRRLSPTRPAVPAAQPMETECSSSRGRRRGQGAPARPQGSGSRDKRGGGGNEKGSSGGKGKEKETEAKGRERDPGFGFDAISRDHDDDSDGSGGGHVPGSAGSVLQGLLRKIGVGLDDLVPASGLVPASSSQQNVRFKNILSGLRSDGEEGRQVEALTQLCEMLSIGTEDSLSTFSVDSYVPVLVGLLNHEGNADIMLLSARAITHLCDVLPSSCAAVVRYGAVPCFCARLLTIEYMDLAEQSLQALKKISQEHPTACLRSGALMAVLSYLDFFSTGVQRVALSTAANMCKKLTSDSADFVIDAVPLLTNLLQYHDVKVLEYASICLTRIAEAFASSPEKLDTLCNHGLVAQAASLISISSSGVAQASLSTSTYTGLIRLLSICVSGSAIGAKTLFLLGISRILKEILSGWHEVSSIFVLPVLNRPPEQILELVKLADELLPPWPQGAISLPSSSNSLVKGSSAMNKSLASVSVKKEDSAGGVAELSAREQLLRDQPELLRQFGLDLLPVLVQVYESSVSGPVRHKCLSVIGKLMFFSTADMIESLLGSTNVASFLAGILAWKDSQALIPSLVIARILMKKLPGTFSKMFVREGVMHAVEMLISADSSLASRADSSEKKDILQETSQTRCGRRRTSSHNVGVGSHENSKMLVAGSTGSPASVEASSFNSNYRTKVSAYAKAFKDKYFPADTVALELFATDDLLHLKNLCGKLNVGMEKSKARGKGKSKASASHLPEILSPNEDHLIGIISELLLQLSKDGGVSTFEFTSSGIVLALLNYFSCGTFSKDKVPEAEMTKFRKQAIKRFKSFVSVALPTGMHEANNQTPLTVLVQKLQSALSSLERFQVILSHPSRSSNGTAHLSTGLSALAQPLKLRLCRAHGEKSLRDFSSNVVLIDPLASLAAVEDFLWPRVHRGESGQKPLYTPSTSEAAQAPSGATASPSAGAHASSGRRSSTRLRSSMSVGVGSIAGEGSKKDSYEGLINLSKGKGKAIVNSSSYDVKGPQTRSSTCRKVVTVSDKGARMKSVHTSSEGVDVDVSRTDMDDELVIEDDDISEDDDDHEMLADDSHPVMPEKVHDVKLNDAAEDSVTPSASGECQTSVTDINERSKPGRGADPIEFRGRAPCASRGAMSFAAAAMAGLTPGGSRSIRSGRDRRGLLIGSSNDSPKLVFSAGGKQISRNLAIYQAVQQQFVFDEDDNERYTSSDLLSGEGSRLSSDVYTIMYQKADNQVDLGAYDMSSSSSVQKSGRFLSASSSRHDSVWKQTSLLDSILSVDLPCAMEKSNPTYNILALLRVLNGLNQLAPRLRVLTASDDFVEGRVSNFDELITSGAVVPSEEFINGKLTPKLTRQVQDALSLCSGYLPSWCYQLTKACPFLFTFETRRQFFYSTAFGLSRALHCLQQQGSENQGFAGERGVRFRRLKRQKVRVSRNRILDSAAQVMEMYSSQKAVLEVEYFGEVGTGLGPTLEFYTLLSHDLQKVNLGMWRSSGTLDNSSMEIDLDEQKERNSVPHTKRVKLLENGATAGVDYVHAPLGLFPRPWLPSVDFSEGSQYYKVVGYFRLVGRVMAKALQDGRLMDLPLSPAFYKLVLGQELDLHDILLFDAELGKTLRELQLLVWRKQYLEFVGTPNLIADLRFRGAPIEDLCLDFTLPGYPDYVLKLREENTMVDISNLEEYISLVVDATTKAGIMRQIEAFRTGFSQVFDITSLQIFSPHELDYLLCGHRELWKAETLVDHIKFDHGYTAKSPAIINLLEIMGEFTPEQQRAFCQFVTGAPQLPPGGLAVLNPKLTIVRKQTSSVASMASNSGVLSQSGDDTLLPSVMTCANYLKLPSYSTKEIMYKKLIYAISEGQGSFDLS